MATSSLIPVSEYLSTMYDPDCDYVDGEIQERNLGEQDHSDLQMRIAMLLSAPQNTPLLRVNPELRVQVKPDRFRVPDICVRSKTAPSEQIVRHPPLLCIEILSPEDTLVRTQQKVRDFLDMGVREVWVVNPAARSVMIFAGSAMVEHTDGELTVPGTPATLAVPEIFKVLDEY
ncbi:MAG TPA: Uma2 family endonuclease [Acidobacteriaceae bacterium]|nr:Uma2 family endonuclease [Acidobacteriaceae bacterium]